MVGQPSNASLDRVAQDDRRAWVARPNVGKLAP